MAITAILVQLRQLAGVIGVAIGMLMLMRVMAEMLHRCALLVLAIDGRRAPGKLERHDNQQQDGEQFFHAADHNIENCIDFTIGFILQVATNASR